MTISILDKNGQRIKLKSGNFKTRKIDLTDWNDKGKAEVWRQAWAEVANKYLTEQNIPQRIDHRSYERQGIEQIPTVHMGVAATQMEHKGIVTEKGEKNRQIKAQNRLLKEVKRRITELEKWIKDKSTEKESWSANPFHSVSIHSPQPPTLLEPLNTAMQQAGQPNSRYGKIRDLKTFAKAVSFLQSNNISTLSELQETLSGMKKRYWNTNSEIKQTEKLLHEQKELIEQAEKYLQYRDCHKAYKQAKPKKQEEYAQRHHAELALYDRAERYLKEHLGNDTKLRPKAWKAEAADLTAQKDRLYREVRKLKEEVAEAETVNRCVEQAVQPAPSKIQRVQGCFMKIF